MLCLCTVLVSSSYMSPPAGDIYCSSLRVCPSVRPSVRPCVTLSCPSHIFKNLSCKKFAKNFKNSLPTEVVQRKIKIQFCQKNLEVLAKKPLFRCLCSSKGLKTTLINQSINPGQISVTIKDRDTGIAIPIVQRQGQICKMSNFGRFWAIFAILISKMALFLVSSLMHLFLNPVAFLRREPGT